jgi:hypothetical protein
MRGFLQKDHRRTSRVAHRVEEERDREEKPPHRGPVLGADQRR